MALSGKQQAFINAYLGDANFNATESARVAGYSGNDNTLAQRGHELVRNSKVAEVIKLRLQESAMSADEVLRHIAEVARDSENNGRLRALELLAKHHGLLVDRIDKRSTNIEIDLNTLTDDQIKRLAAGEDIASIMVNE